MQVVSPLQIPCKSHFPPIHRNGSEADYKRRKSEPVTKVERRMNEGISKDVIRSFRNWCNTLEKKKTKKFLEGVLHLLTLCAIFLLIISTLSLV